MALKIIGVGFGRTGTESLYTALPEIGFPCYHMKEVLFNKANKSHIDFWLNVANAAPGSQHNWQDVFANYTAAVDNPACCVWRDLMQAYPDAKVILSLHPKGAEAWYESTLETIYFSETMWQFKVLEALTPFGRKMGAMTRKLIWQRNHQGTMATRERAIAYYQQHIDTIKAEVPADKLLIFKATDGWAPLCQFLGVPVPAMPYPNINSRLEFQKIKDDMKRGAYVVMGMVALGIAAVAWAAMHFLG